MPHSEEHKHVFVTVAGSTPQIITESLYDLIVQQKKTIEEIHIITTRHGKERCERMTGDFPNGPYYRFLQDYKLNPIDISIRVHLITDENGRPLEDIRDERDNQNAANFIVDFIQNLCARPDITVLASLSGGRKTMSAYMAYAMQMHGRRRDHLYHVLVAPPELEFNPDFYYPPPGNKEITLRANGESITLKADTVKITNAEIPFVRIRDFIDFADNLGHELSYTDQVEMTQKSLDQVFRTRLDFSNMQTGVVTVCWENDACWKVRLAPAEISLYKMIYDLQVMHNSQAELDKHQKAFDAIYHTIVDALNKRVILQTRDISDYRSKINKKLEKTIRNKYILRYILIDSMRSKPYPIYTFGAQG